MEISAVAATILIVNDPDVGTTFAIRAVVSSVRITHSTIEFADTSEFVTVTVVPAAAILTVPVSLFIVWFPVVPPAVTVVGYETSPFDATVTCVTSAFSDDPELPAGAV